jgi:hypothetical protein
VAAERATPQHGWFEMLVTPTPVVRWALIIGLGTAVLQQVCPVPAAARSPHLSDLCPTVSVVFLRLRWRGILEVGVCLLGRAALYFTTG